MTTSATCYHAVAVPRSARKSSAQKEKPPTPPPAPTCSRPRSRAHEVAEAPGGPSADLTRPKTSSLPPPTGTCFPLRGVDWGICLVELDVWELNEGDDLRLSKWIRKSSHEDHHLCHGAFDMADWPVRQLRQLPKIWGTEPLDHTLFGRKKELLPTYSYSMPSPLTNSTLNSDEPLAQHQPAQPRPWSPKSRAHGGQSSPASGPLGLRGPRLRPGDSSDSRKCVSPNQKCPEPTEVEGPELVYPSSVPQ